MNGPPVEREAQRGNRHSKPCFIAGDPQVAGQGQLGSRADHRAVNIRNDRDRGRHDGPQHAE